MCQASVKEARSNYTASTASLNLMSTRIRRLYCMRKKFSFIGFVDVALINDYTCTVIDGWFGSELERTGREDFEGGGPAKN